MVFLAKNAGQGLLLQALTGQQGAADPSKLSNKSAAAGQVAYQGTAYLGEWPIDIHRLNLEACACLLLWCKSNWPRR